jgi:hypothetical protein
MLNAPFHHGGTRARFAPLIRFNIAVSTRSATW